MTSFSVITLGCKVNRYESEAISEQLAGQGWCAARKGDKADLCVINTCMVTQKAAMQARQAVRKAVRGHPGALVVVTGCYAQLAPQVFSSMDGVLFVVGNAFKDRMAQIVGSHGPSSSPVDLVEDISQPRPFQDLPITQFGTRTRPFLKIQDGCDAFCAYCIIPYARGRSCSLEPETVLNRLDTLGGGGYKEVVLCGINLGRYGLDLHPPNSLANLLQMMDRNKGVNRLRLSSIEPKEVSEELVRLLSASRHICPHLHIPLQSGDDEVLKRMNRPYGSAFYRDLIHHIVEAMPKVGIGVDVMVGFPGESDRAFENSFRLIESLPVAYLHVFPFSPQVGTAAEGMKDRVQPHVTKRRAKHMRELGQIKRKAFFERSIGQTAEVLIEGNRDKATGYLKGLTDNYVPVLVKGPDDWFHHILPVRLTRIENSRIFGDAGGRFAGLY
jgi:threonylcarbamoyladenosine tRNA methylthiotransferase MtaB